VQGIKVSKLEKQRALEILAPENARFSSVLCGECLYNIIAALRDEDETACPILSRKRGCGCSHLQPG
jgi:hypothetical protein